MCDEAQTLADDLFYPTVESLTDYDNGDFSHPIKLAANGACYAKHNRCGRYVQYNNICTWCHNFKRFPLMEMVSFVQQNTPRERDTLEVKRMFQGRLDNMLKILAND